MNKYANFYIETTLEQLDQQYKIVNEQLEEIYKKYSKDHDILIQELSRIMMDFNIKGEFMDLDNKTQININKDMQGKIKNMIDNEKVGETESINNILRDAAANTYNYQDYILSLGLDFTSLPLTEKQITKIVNNKIAGEIWSNRLWDNKKGLEVQLKKDIDDFIKGKLSVNKIGSNIKNNFNASRYNSQRLARTELCRVQQEVLNKFDEEHDVEWQLFMGTLDNKTSSACREKDGQQYKITDNSRPIPPLHPHCRSAMVGIPHKDYKPSTRRDNETGDIIDYKNYNEWSGKATTKETDKKTIENKYAVNRKDVKPPIKRKSRDEFNSREEYMEHLRERKKEMIKVNEYINKKIEDTKSRPIKYTREQAEKIILQLGADGASLKNIDKYFYEDIVEALKINRNFAKNVDIGYFGDVEGANKIFKETYEERIKRNAKYYMENDKISYEKALQLAKDLTDKEYIWDEGLIDAGWGIVFNPKAFKDFEYVMAQEFESFIDGYRALGDGTFKTTITHEYGHKLGKYIHSHANISERTIVENVLKKYPNKYISEYATTNTSEYFAELYADYLLNPNKTEDVVYFGELLNEALGGVK